MVCIFYLIDNFKRLFMKSFCIFTVVFLFLGICSIAAQDLIVLRDGNMIEAKVIEISPTEIRYKRSDNLEGPTIIIPADRVLSIKYKNGAQEIINADTNTGQKNKPVDTTPAMDPDKFIFAMSANLGISSAFAAKFGGEFLFVPSVCLEFGKGHFNSEVHIFMSGGLVTFNYFWPNRVGGFYLGGGCGGGGWENLAADEYGLLFPTVGLNIGWKFVTQSGVYFRTGTYLGVIYYYGLGVYIRPDLAIGYCFK
jgi:hypothetical protein